MSSYCVFYIYFIYYIKIDMNLSDKVEIFIEKNMHTCEGKNYQLF